MVFDKEKVGFGAILSPWDNKRLNYTVRLPTFNEAEALPKTYDGLRQFHSPEGYDQGSVGTCVGWSTSIAMEVIDKIRGLHVDDLSAGWIYVRSRDYANVNPLEEGSTILGAMKTLNHEGALWESDYPTDITTPFEESVEPPNAQELAATHAIDSYWRIDTSPASLKAAIYGVTHKQPYTMVDGSDGKASLILAIPVYESFFDGEDNGIVPKPDWFEGLRGWHATDIDGWKEIDGKIYYTNQGTWGLDTGDKGLFYLPEDYPISEAWLIHPGERIPKPSGCWLCNWLSNRLIR